MSINEDAVPNLVNIKSSKPKDYTLINHIIFNLPSKVCQSIDL